MVKNGNLNERQKQQNLNRLGLIPPVMDGT
jgi:hypothetical protein